MIIVAIVLFIIGIIFGLNGFMRQKKNAVSAFIFLSALLALSSIVFRVYIEQTADISMSRIEVYFWVFMPLIMVLGLGYFAGEFFRYLDIRINGEPDAVKGGRTTGFFNSIGSRLSPAKDYGKDLSADVRTAVIICIWLFKEHAASIKQLNHSIFFEFRVNSHDQVDVREMVKFVQVSDQDVPKRIEEFGALGTAAKTDMKQLYEHIVRIGLRSKVDLMQVKTGLKTLAEHMNISLLDAQFMIEKSIEQTSTDM